MTEPTKAERIVTLREGGFVKRWHADRIIQEDLVGQHSHQMLVLGYTILEDRMTPALAKAVTFHDAGHEGLVGDWPWGAKKPLSNNRARDLEHELAEMVREKLRIVVELTDQEASDLAFLDLLEPTFYALDEVKMGNRFMEVKAENCVRVLMTFPQMQETGIRADVLDVLSTTISDSHPWKKELFAI